MDLGVAGVSGVGVGLAAHGPNGGAQKSGAAPSPEGSTSSRSSEFTARDESTAPASRSTAAARDGTGHTARNAAGSSARPIGGAISAAAAEHF